MPALGNLNFNLLSINIQKEVCMSNYNRFINDLEKSGSIEYLYEGIMSKVFPDKLITLQKATKIDDL
jgi:hypothetical protein